VDGLQKVLVFRLALLFGIREGWDVPKVAFLFELLRTARGKFK
jgi:hypothetical protein